MLAEGSGGCRFPPELLLFAHRILESSRHFTQNKSLGPPQRSWKAEAPLFWPLMEAHAPNKNSGLLSRSCWGGLVFGSACKKPPGGFVKIYGVGVLHSIQTLFFYFYLFI